MADSTRQLVERRAGRRCEYCHLPQAGHRERFSIDHIVPRKHSSGDDAMNLALCCLHCNFHKGSNLSGIDRITGRVVELFDPRRQAWGEHFRWQSSIAIGITPTDRATVEVLGMNALARRQLREQLIAEDVFHLD